MDASVISGLQTIVYDAILLKELVVASFALLVYDFLNTFTDEVTYIWESSWNVAKYLFFATRYLALIDTSLAMLYALHPGFSQSMCDKLYLSICCLITAGLLIAEAILSLRTFALWKGTRSVGALLAIMYTILVVSAICLLPVTLRNNTFPQAPPPLRNVVSCVDQSPRQGIVAIMLLTLAQEFVIAALTLWKTMSHWRGGTTNPIRRVIFRDCILFFVLLLVMSAINATLYSAQSLSNIYDLVLILQRVLHSIVSGRVILHLHAAAKELAGHFTDGFDIYDATTKLSVDGNARTGGEVIVLGRLDLDMH